MSEIILAFVVTIALLYIVLMSRYGLSGLVASTILSGVIFFMILFWTPAGSTIIPAQIQSWNALGGWRYIITVMVWILGMFGVTSSLNLERTIRDKMERGYFLTFQKFPWQPVGPLLSLVIVAGFFEGPPESTTAALSIEILSETSPFGVIVVSVLAIVFIVAIVWKFRGSN